MMKPNISMIGNDDHDHHFYDCIELDGTSYYTHICFVFFCLFLQLQLPSQ